MLAHTDRKESCSIMTDSRRQAARPSTLRPRVEATYAKGSREIRSSLRQLA